jgi:hypothetical protein
LCIAEHLKHSVAAPTHVDISSPAASSSLFFRHNPFQPEARAVSNVPDFREFIGTF